MAGLKSGSVQVLHQRDNVVAGLKIINQAIINSSQVLDHPCTLCTRVMPPLHISHCLGITWQDSHSQLFGRKISISSMMHLFFLATLDVGLTELSEIGDN